MEEKNILSGQAAEDLLLRVVQGEEGRRAFNQQMSAMGNSARMVCRDVDFQKLREASPDGVLRFENLEFKWCIADFSGVDFGSGGVSFARSTTATFVDFSDANFGDGVVDFSNSSLSTIVFDGAEFGGQDPVVFEGASLTKDNEWLLDGLGSRDLNFSRCEGRGKSFEVSGRKFTVKTVNHLGRVINFDNAIFRCSHRLELDFIGSQELEDLSFRNSVWRGGHASLHNITFQNKTHFVFTESDLTELSSFAIYDFSAPSTGLVIFQSTKFPMEGHTAIEFANLGSGALSFESIRAAGDFHLLQRENCHWNSHVSFENASFGGGVHLVNLSLGVVPNLIATQFSKHLSLDGVKYSYDRKARLVSKDPVVKNASRLQRLKELAENNRDHRFALQCHADEMRARRWQRSGFWARAADVLDEMFDLVSDYGQSIARPFAGLITVIALFSVAYHYYSPRFLVTDTLDFISYSFAMTIPFLPASTTLRNDTFVGLFGSPGLVDVGAIYTLMTLQGLVSFTLLFLLGLGLRNRFRI